MLEALLYAFIVFTAVFFALRGLEWGYHRLRRTPDWSPHWGSWVFAVLCGIYGFVQAFGR